MTRKHENNSSSRDRFASDARHLADSAEVNEVFSSMARMLKRSVRSSWCAVYLIDQDGHGFAPPRTYTLPEKLTTALQLMPILPSKAAQLRSMLARRRQILMYDPLSAAMLAPELRKLLASFSLLAVPMHVRQQLQGVVLLARSRRLGLITPTELKTVRELVSQVSLVAGNLRLSEELLDMSIEMAKRIDTIMTLDDINKAISSSLSHEQIFATAADRIEGLIQCDLQIIAVKQLDSLKVISVRGGDTLMAESFTTDRTVEVQEVIHTAGSAAKILHIPDMCIDLQPCPFRQELMAKGIRSLITVPLVTSQGVQGILILGDRQPGLFQSDELFAVEKVAAQLAVALANAWLFEEMRQMFFSTVASLANAIDAKSSWTMGHSERVMNIAANIAREMGFDEEGIERVRLGGLLHDIGKIGVMEALLEKPEELDEDDFPPIRLHPEKGVAILAPIAQLKSVLPAILHHHEFYNGSGYPAGLAGEAIPLDARIITVADSFDAMVADRPYRKGLKVEEAAGELARCAGSQFDPVIVDRFRSMLARLLKNPAINQPE